MVPQRIVETSRGAGSRAESSCRIGPGCFRLSDLDNGPRKGPVKLRVHPRWSEARESEARWVKCKGLCLCPIVLVCLLLGSHGAIRLAAGGRRNVFHSVPSEGRHRDRTIQAKYGVLVLCYPSRPWFSLDYRDCTCPHRHQFCGASLLRCSATLTRPCFGTWWVAGWDPAPTRVALTERWASILPFLTVMLGDPCDAEGFGEVAIYGSRNHLGGMIMTIGAGARKWIPKPQVAPEDPKGHKPRTGKERPDKCENPAVVLNWKGYKWCKGLSKQDLYTDKRTAAEIKEELDAHAKDVDGCVFTALLAAHRFGDDRSFFKRQWRGLSLPEMYDTVDQFARWKKIEVTVLFLVKGGHMEKRSRTFGPRDARKWTLLIVPAGGGRAHALPIFPNLKAVIDVPLAVAKDLEGVPEAGEAVPPEAPVLKEKEEQGPGAAEKTAVKADEAAPEGPKAVEAGGGEKVPPVEAAKEPPKGGPPDKPVGRDAAAECDRRLREAQQKRVAKRLLEHQQQGAARLVKDATERQPWQAGPGTWSANGESPKAPDAPVDTPQQVAVGPSVRRSELEDHPLALFAEAFRESGAIARKTTFYGIQPPPKELGAQWIGGWFESQLGRAAEPVDLSVENLFVNAARNTVVNRALIKPTYASATIPNFQRWGSQMLYVPVNLAEGLQTAGRRSVTDGNVSVEYFLAGDCLRCGTARWTVKRVEGLLHVECANLSAKMSPRWRCVQNAPTASQMTAEAARKAQWLQVVNEAKEPAMINILQRLKADEAAKGYPGDVDPHDAVAVATQMADRLSYQQVGAPFLWGYCFSCGEGLPNKMKHRLCKECDRGRNTPLAQLVADGRRVTSVANPIVYPGVVNTLSRHPRLKAGVQSIASDKNFRWPRRA